MYAKENLSIKEKKKQDKGSNVLLGSLIVGYGATEVLKGIVNPSLKHGILGMAYMVLGALIF